MSQLVRTPQPLDLAALSILVVDDQPFFRVLLTEVLRSLGVGSVSVAVDGEDGFSAFEDMCPDIVVTDWMMPKLDGLDMTRRIRALPDSRFQQVPVILVTAKSERTQIEFARTAGIDEFILKPISGKAICDRLREVIEKPRPFVNFATYTGPCRRRRAESQWCAPYRRFSDTLDVGGIDDALLIEGLRSVFVAACARISLLVKGLVKNRGNIKPIVAAVAELHAIADDLADPYLSRVCGSLLGATQPMAKGGASTAELIETHVTALNILLRTPTSDIKKRDDIVFGLERTVKQAHAA